MYGYFSSTSWRNFGAIWHSSVRPDEGLDDHRSDSGIACTQIDGESGKTSKYLPKWDSSCHLHFFDRNLSKYFCKREREGTEESTFAQYFQRRIRRKLNAPAPHTHTFFYLPFLHSIKFIYGTKTDEWSPSGPVSAPVTHVFFSAAFPYVAASIMWGCWAGGASGEYHEVDELNCARFRDPQGGKCFPVLDRYRIDASLSLFACAPLAMRTSSIVSLFK